MDKDFFSPADQQQLQSHGLSLQACQAQLQKLAHGRPSLRLDRPCRLGDGIRRLSAGELTHFSRKYESSLVEGQVEKFVPASGAASRMFKVLTAYWQDLRKGQDSERSKNPQVEQFFREWERLPFAPLLRSQVEKGESPWPGVHSQAGQRQLLEALLGSEGLHYGRLPKALLPFHAYPDNIRTAFEEQLVEAQLYAQGRDGVCRLHFTISKDHREGFENLWQEVRPRYEKNGTSYQIDFSYQDPKTDTIAATMDGQPFRDEQGSLVFRPGGHGSLLGNLANLEADLVFIKNIDNVTVDRLKSEGTVYKQAMAGLLLELQEKAFSVLRTLQQEIHQDQTLATAQAFIEEELQVKLPMDFAQGPREDRKKWLWDRLNRPLRVCGMVSNEGEPGGGPYWVKGEQGLTACQIVEAAQVNLAEPTQKTIFQQATHFNPVDMVCGLKDFKGKKFNLADFVDPQTYLISKKSHQGRELLALEWPGLWNGAMAGWNTVLVEVPLSTFTPVKTVLDLLRPEHQG